MTERVTCEGCKFWERLRETEPDIWIGECRVRSPYRTKTTNAKDCTGTWINTMFDDWCGEGRAKGQDKDNV